MGVNFGSVKKQRGIAYEGLFNSLLYKTGNGLTMWWLTRKTELGWKLSLPKEDWNVSTSFILHQHPLKVFVQCQRPVRGVSRRCEEFLTTQ